MSTILIAAPEHLQALKEREDFSDAQTFSDSEALRALEVITRKRPQVVALERLFAATTRGAALINRIKADPKLASCEIRIVAHDSEYARVPGARPDSETDGAAGAVAVAAPAPASAPLDQTGTRRSPRFPIVDGVEVMVDGNTATLINLSLVGAQVVSPTILKPNQRLRIALVEGRRRSSLRRRDHSTAPASSSSTPSPTPSRSSATTKRSSRNQASCFENQLRMIVSSRTIVSDRSDPVEMMAHGGSVHVTVDACPDTTFVGRVSKISNSARLTSTSTQSGSTDKAVD